MGCHPKVKNKLWSTTRFLSRSTFAFDLNNNVPFCSQNSVKRFQTILLKLLALSSGIVIMILFRTRSILRVMLGQHLVREEIIKFLQTKISRAQGFLKHTRNFLPMSNCRVWHFSRSPQRRGKTSCVPLCTARYSGMLVCVD